MYYTDLLKMEEHVDHRVSIGYDVINCVSHAHSPDLSLTYIEKESELIRQDISRVL